MVSARPAMEVAGVILLAMSERESLLSLLAQLGSMIGAALVGRYCLRSRDAIWVISLVGALGAMVAHIAVDGQGACAALIYTPLIYLAAVAGRDDLP